jgi:hypothetical protein
VTSGCSPAPSYVAAGIKLEAAVSRELGKESLAHMIDNVVQIAWLGKLIDLVAT